jgi:hypothetical protein
LTFFSNQLSCGSENNDILPSESIVMFKKLSFLILFIGLFIVNLSDSLSADTPKKIMFIVHTETINGKGVLQMYKTLKARGHDIKIVAMPLLISGDKIRYDMDLEFAKKFDPKDVFYPCGTTKPYTACKPLENYQADIVFIQNPYNSVKGSMLDPHFTLEGLRKIAKKTAYIVYGPHLFHQTTCNNIELKKVIDLVFVDSASTKKIFVEDLEYDPKNVMVSSFQNYKNVRELMKTYTKPKDSPYKETILWLPRWTLSFNYRDQHEGGSTFMNYYHFFYNHAVENPDVKLVVRPHAGLNRFAIDSKFLSQKDLDEIINKFKSLKNVTWSEHLTAPLEDDVIQADIVIADGTSALGEVVVANKPIIYLSNGWDNEFNSNDLGHEFKDYLYMARDPNMILSHMATIRSTKFKPNLGYEKDPKHKTMAM